jgi:hypothetical protein
VYVGLHRVIYDYIINIWGDIGLCRIISDYLGFGAADLVEALDLVCVCVV